MKILAFSDLHRDREAADRIAAQSGMADLVIGAGDFADDRRGLCEIMERLAPVASKAIFVPGNNESYVELFRATEAQVLHGCELAWYGIRIGGIGGGVPPVPGADGTSWDVEEADARRLLERIESADILISHSPPFGLGDSHAQAGHVGSRAVREAVARLAPALCLFGHVHDSWGARGRTGPTEWRNLGPDPVWFEL